MIQKNISLEDLEGELWKECTESSQYLVSNLGRVKSKSYEYYFVCNKQFVKKSIKIVKQSDFNSKKYWRIGLMISKKQKHFAVHRLVAQCFIENLQNLPMVNHIDGDRNNNKVENLEWISNEDNMLHAWRTGLRKKGVYNINHKSNLTEKQALEIVNLFENKTNIEIAKLYNVKVNSISELKAGRCWSNITNINVKLTPAIEKYSLEDRFLIYKEVNDRIILANNISKKYNISLSTLNNLCIWCKQNIHLNINQ